MKEKKVADYITDALFELLKTKKMVDITTTEIIKKAGFETFSVFTKNGFEKIKL